MADDIRAGGAFAEIYVKDQKLVSGLARAQQRLRDFGSAVNQVGKWMLGLSAAVLAPLAIIEAAMGTKLSAKAGQFQKALVQLGLAVLKAAGNISESLGPAVGEFLNGLTGVILKAADWVKANREIVTTAVKVAAIVGGVGAALMTLGAIAAQLATALGWVGTGITAAAAVFSFLAAALAAIATPMGLLIVGFAAAAAAVLYFARNTAAVQALGRAFSNVFSWIGDAIGVLVADFGKAWEGIAAALKAGDIEAAWAVVTATLSLEWARVVAWFSEKWNGFFIAWSGVTQGIASFFIDAVATMKSTWATAIGFLSKLWEDWKNSMSTEWLAGIFAPLIAWLEGVDVEDVRKNLAQDFAAKRKAAPKFAADVDKDTAEKKAAIEAARKAAQAALPGTIAGQNVERQAATDAAQQRLKDAEAKRDQAVAAAKALPGAKIPEMPKDSAAIGTSAITTFSATAAAGMGTGGDAQLRVAKEQLTEMKALKELNKNLVNILRGLGLELAP